MDDPNTYSVKEMITEFREDVEKSFSSVNNRLDKIDTKQAIANGRTAKLELWQKLVIGGALVAFVLGGTIITLAILVENNIIDQKIDKNNQALDNKYLNPNAYDKLIINNK